MKMTVQKFNMFAAGFCASTIVSILLLNPKNVSFVVMGLSVTLVMFLGSINFFMGLQK